MAGRSIDEQSDLQLAVVATLVATATRAVLGEVLRTVYQDPRSISEGNKSGFPALAIYRASQRRRRLTSAPAQHEITIVLDYVLPDSSLQAREKVWPTLQAFWLVASDAICAGRHSSLQGGADVYTPVGLGVEDEGTARVQFGFSGDARSYPFFRGQVVLVHEPTEGDPSGGIDPRLAPFTEFFASFDKPNGNHATPLATDTVILPPYEPWPPP